MSPAPYWGNVALEESLKRAQIASMSAQQSARSAALAEQIKMREMQERHFATQQEVLETQAAMQLQQYQMQYGVGMAEVDVARGRLRLDERKQVWTEYEKMNLPTFQVVDGAVVALYPDGRAMPAWQKPPEPTTLTTDQFLVDPVTGQPIWAPPLTTVTDTEILITDRLTGELINRVPITQLPPKAVFRTTLAGETEIYSEQGEFLNRITSPGTEAKMQQMAAEAEQDRLLAASQEERLWKQMRIDENIAAQLNITTLLAAQIDAAVRKYGFDVTAAGYQLTAETKRELNVSSEKIAQIEGFFNIKVQELVLSGVMAGVDVDMVLGKGKELIEIEKVGIERERVAIAWKAEGRADEYLEIARAGAALEADRLALATTTEEREREQMFITRDIAVRAQLSAEEWKRIDTVLAREGYALDRDMKMIEFRIASMTDLTERQKIAIMAGFEERRIRMESGRIEAEVEAGRFVTRGDVTVRRDEDGTFDIAFEWPQERYGLTPMLVGDEKSGYSIAMIDPYKGTANVLGVLPGGAEGAEDAKRHLELLDMARKMVDPGNTFLTTVDPAVKEEMYRQTMALYSDLIQAPRPAGMGYTPEEAAKFTTPMELWRAQDVSLTFGGALAEPSAKFFEEFLQEQPYGKATATPPTPPGGQLKIAPPEAVETKKPKKTAQAWVNEFKGVRSGEISALQRFMINEGLWDGEVDGKWSIELERKFKIAFRKEKIDIRETGE